MITAVAGPLTGSLPKIASAEPATKRQLSSRLAAAFSAALRTASSLTSTPWTDSKWRAAERAKRPEPQ